MKHIFLSWSRETKTVAESIDTWLVAKNAGIDCWFSPEDINAGQQWRDEINKAVQAVDCAIMCIGPSAVGSPWVLYEAGAIGSRKPLIPVTLLIPASSIPPILSAFQVLSGYSSNNLSPDPGFPTSLIKGINSVTGAEIPTERDEHDSKLLADLETFANARVEHLRARLQATMRSDILLGILRYVKANRSSSPQAIADSGHIKNLSGKKFFAALDLFWLKENGYLNIEGFENLTSGKVELSYDGEMLLTYVDSIE